jgi:DNA-binding TFAR19-related protein (PDSD5 family)
MQFIADETKLKKLLKAAVVEVLEERRDLVRDALADAVEDIGMVKAIKAGSRSRTISRAEVFKILRKNR